MTRPTPYVFMPVFARVVVLFVSGLLVVVPSVQAQSADTTQLPEIAPREIEIRGERQIDLPSLERQPLSGFASPPQVPTVPPDHRPYVGAYQQTLDDLPESLPIPETVSSALEPPADPARGYLEGGGGRYAQRFFEGRVGVPLSSSERLSILGRYSGMEDAPKDDIAEARVRLESSQGPLQIDAEGHGTVQRYDLYGVSSTASREGYTSGASLSLRHHGPTDAQLAAHYDYTQYTSALTTRPTDRTYSQAQLGLRGAATLPVPLRPRLDVRYRRSWFGGDPINATGDDLDAGAQLRLYETASATIEGGVRVLTYRMPALPTRDARRSRAAYVSPSVHLEWRFSERARLAVRNRPRLRETSLEQLYKTNPYADHAPSLQPTLETVNTEAEVTYDTGPVRLAVTAGYRYAPVYRYFDLARSSDPTSAGLYEVEYDPARVLHGGTHLAIQGVEGLQASIGVNVRDGTLRPNGGEIPNFAPITADAMLALSFADGDGFVKMLGHFESPRFASTTRSRRIRSYLTFGVESSYAVGSNIAVVARAEQFSIDSPLQWARYPRPPAQISAGLRFNW